MAMAEVEEAAATTPSTLTHSLVTSIPEQHHRLILRPNWQRKAIHLHLDLARHHLHQAWDTTTAEGTTRPIRTTVPTRTTTTTTTTRTAIASQTAKARAKDTEDVTSISSKATMATLEEGGEGDVGMTSTPMVTEEAVGAEAVEAVEAAVEPEGAELEETTIGTDT